jgi:hypothetical protein
MDAGAFRPVVEGLNAGPGKVIQDIQAIGEDGGFEGAATEAAEIGAIRAQEELGAGDLTP